MHQPKHLYRTTTFTTFFQKLKLKKYLTKSTTVISKRQKKYSPKSFLILGINDVPSIRKTIIGTTSLKNI